jgi:hypothetical protein
VATESVPEPSRPFNTWKDQLRQDCERHDNLAAFEALGNYVLRILWESGIDPTVQGVCTQQPEWPN